MLFVPFVAGFSSIYPLRRTALVFFVDFAFNFVFALGVLLRLRTSFVSAHGIIECRTPADVWVRVQRQPTFWLDVFSLVAEPLLYICSQGWLSWLGFLRLAKCWRLIPNSQRRMLLSVSSGSVFVRMLNIVLLVFGMTHIYGCIWFAAKMYSPL